MVVEVVIQVNQLKTLCWVRKFEKSERVREPSNPRLPVFRRGGDRDARKLQFICPACHYECLHPFQAVKSQ